MNLVAVDLARGGARGYADCLAVQAHLKALPSAATLTTLRAWIMPTWMRWVATMVEPRWDTRRCTMTGPVEGAGALAAWRAPRSRCQSRGGPAGQCAQELAVVADDGHLGAVHAERDALAGEFVADIQLRASEADQAG
jgi:hypothetical protein